MTLCLTFAPTDYVPRYLRSSYNFPWDILLYMFYLLVSRSITFLFCDYMLFTQTYTYSSSLRRVSAEEEVYTEEK